MSSLTAHTCAGPEERRPRGGLWSGVAAAALGLAALAALLALGARLTEGRWVYTLDDAYIHLAMARNVALRGEWGLTPGEFVSCSSSPLWTLLLGGVFALSGVREWVPGVLNVACVMASLVVLDRLLLARGVAGAVRVSAAAALLVLTPLTVIASTGMEHSLHVLFTLLLLRSAASALAAGRRLGWRSAAGLCAWAFLATATRFEALFLVLPFAVLLCANRRWGAGLALLGAGALPVALHGAFSLAHGGFFLPNSLVLKGRFPEGGAGALLFQLFSMYVKVSLENVHVHLLGLALLATAGCRRVDRPLRLLALGVAAGCCAQVTFSECGRFYRYEAYLMASGLCLLALAWLPGLDVRRGWTQVRARAREDGWLLVARAGLLAALVVPLSLRGVWATSRIPRASANIYGQQWQLARIFQTFDTRGARVAVNDLGLMAFRSGTAWLDLWGLGTPEVARLKRAKRYDRAAVASLLERHGVGYVAVFDQWFARGRELPESLVRVGRLRIVGNIVCLEESVQLYAAGAEEASRLRAHLESLPFQLPRGTSIELAAE